MENESAEPVCEEHIEEREDPGYRLDLVRVSTRQIDLKWGKYKNSEEKIMAFNPRKSTIVSHFRLPEGIATKRDEDRERLKEKEFVVYREAAGPYHLKLAPTGDKTRAFFELGISEQLFCSLVTDESKFLTRFQNNNACEIPAYDFTGVIQSQMCGIIAEMKTPPFHGYLNAVFLESKAIELFLTQIRFFDQEAPARYPGLKQADVERLYWIREFIEQHYDEPLSIIDLSRLAGINQMKLKNGFRELFQNTVFGYIGDLRMQEAKRLLLSEKLMVNEVSDRIGYKHPQHFTAAFKKRFGILPGTMRNL